MRYTLPTPQPQPYQPPAEVTPEPIRKYLLDAGWSEQFNFDRTYYRNYNDITITGYFTWEQAVAWSLVKPFLGN